MTAEQQYQYEERMAICLDSGIAPERAEQIAREQVEDQQGALFEARGTK